MGIGYRIKEARERMGLTQIELGNMVGVTGSAITNYEKETSHPKEQIIYRLMENLNVDANYLFQDVVNLPKRENDVTLIEYELLKKYRDLDDHGKEMVDFTLEKEWERSVSLKRTISYNQTILNAAHERTDIEVTDEMRQHDNDIMNDDSEWE
jgi:transcriptional regulator with XRE-family HTH domain